MGDHRVVSREVCSYYIEHMDRYGVLSNDNLHIQALLTCTCRLDLVLFSSRVCRPEGAADVRYAEASMKNGFGLMHLHKFLSIPFLQLQVSHTHQ